MKTRFTLLVLILCAVTGRAQTSAIYNLRSDTIDVLHYQVNLAITDFTGNTIAGNTRITLSPKMATASKVTFDLLKLTVDSVMYNGSPMVTSYNDTLLVCHFPAPVNDADTVEVTVYYHGVAQLDPTWGGFYFQSGYAYNLGVGFTSVPHNFGRVWHPCFDNFVERATYEFNITTNGGKVAYCNGVLAAENIAGGNTTRKWVMQDPIPTYLACVAVNSYTHVNQQYLSSVTSNITPITLISLPADTTNFKNSFVNLPNAIEAYEIHYGPYEWDKVGFVAVPFNSGAMEHATCIAYPRATLTGTTTYQNLMAHELSHHWWGDLVTCETAEDMWINEGMARWSEALFFEHIGGYSAYMNDLRPNHKAVIWKAHIDDGGFYPISGVPQNVTYGTTTYNKGADVVHTMRGYLGDSLFFAGLHHVIANNKFKNLNATQFRDQLNSVSGINVTDFFNDWVFQPGFPEFAVDSFTVAPDGVNFDITVYSKQKLRGATHLATNVPMQVAFKNNTFQSFSAMANLSGASQVFTIQDVPFNPSVVFFNENERISEAVTAHQVNISATGTKLFGNANMNLQVQAISDTVWARIEQHWVAADPFVPANMWYTISPDRFWRIHLTGDTPGFRSKATFQYNGTTAASGNLDNGLMAVLPAGVFNEDSLRLFHRANAGENWRQVTACTFTTGPKTDKAGSVTIDSIKAGDYALGIKTSAVGITEYNAGKSSWTVYPNPATHFVTVELKDMPAKGDTLIITDLAGNILKTLPLLGTRTDIDLSGFAKSSYLLTRTRAGQKLETRKIIRN